MPTRSLAVAAAISKTDPKGCSAVIVIDEYLVVRVLLADWPSGVPDDDLALPASRHWRLLQALHAPSNGQLSRILSLLPDSDREVVRHPRPDIFQVLDPPSPLGSRCGDSGTLRRDRAIDRGDPGCRPDLREALVVRDRRQRRSAPRSSRS